jgi:hypothetical protein
MFLSLNSQAAAQRADAANQAASQQEERGRFGNGDSSSDYAGRFRSKPVPSNASRPGPRRSRLFGSGTGAVRGAVNVPTSVPGSSAALRVTLGRFFARSSVDAGSGYAASPASLGTIASMLAENERGQKTSTSMPITRQVMFHPTYILFETDSLPKVSP